MQVFCPRCGHKSEHELLTWDASSALPFVCEKCQEFSWLRKQQNTEDLIITDIFKAPQKELPPLVEGTPVYINNREHEFYLERGIIVGRGHIYYRVSFSSLDKRINGKKVWMPAHWIMVVPKELL